jgi:hypothetical protein
MPRTYAVLLMSGLALGICRERAAAEEPHAGPARPPAPAADGGVTNTAKPTKPKKPRAEAEAAPGASAVPNAAKVAKRKKPKAAAEQAPKPVANSAAAPAPIASPHDGAEERQASAPRVQPPKPQPVAAVPRTTCSLEEREQPRGGRLDVVGSGFGQAPVVRIAQRPVRMLERRTDRVSVQVPADSDGGEVTLQTEGRSASCGALVIIGKNR